MTHNADGFNAISSERLGCFFTSPFNSSCYLQHQEYYKNATSAGVPFPMDCSRDALHQDDLKTDTNMQENILNISRTVYAVTYPSSQNFEEIYRNSHQRSEHYGANLTNNNKPMPFPVSSLERAFFSPSFKENTRQQFPRNHIVKQEPITTEYDDLSSKLEEKLKKTPINRPNSLQSSNGRRGSLQLWQFLVTLLDTPDASAGCIAWTGRGMEFKLIEPEEVARRWGAQKNRPAMNYDKLSRSLRYYYEKGIMQKVAGERYVYKFVCDPDALFNMAYNSQTENNCKLPTSGNLQESWPSKPDIQNIVQPKKINCYNCEIPMPCQHTSSYLQENNHSLYI